MPIRLLNDDFTDIQIVRPSSYGYAQPDMQKVSRRKKRPLGFIHPEPPKKPRQRTAKPKKGAGS